jgi:glycosyltransferase involved in cell wall biosynthesis
MQEASPSARRRAFVVGCDAKSNIRMMSGITYHLAEQGVQDGVFSGMVNLYPRAIHAWSIYGRAGWWKLKGGFGGRHGFKFTNSFLDAIWRRNLPVLADSRVVNNFQLFGPHFLRSYSSFGIEPYFYIDGTLREYFNGYSAFDTAGIDQAVIRRALVIEREGYENCCKIVVMSRRTATNIIQDYHIPQEKVCIVPPGANISERLLARLDDSSERSPRADRGRLVVGFIGLYPERKGLPTISDAVELLRHAGYDVRLHLIGKCPTEISERDGVTYHGLIDKNAEMDRFLRILRNVDVGCMLSRAELTGIALLEFLRMGIPIIATDVGGIPDIVELGAGQLVMPEISAAELAQHFARLVDEPHCLAELQESAWLRRKNASWRRVVRELNSVLNQPATAEP